jgi:hypothetical protein
MEANEVPTSATLMRSRPSRRAAPIITGVAHLPGGTLSVVGLASKSPISRFAIVGGTPAYATARGELIVRNIGGENSNLSADTVQLWT